MKAVVVTFDRLSVRFLGCYGKTWVSTANFDRLAARSVLFEQHFATTVDPADASLSWITGRNASTCANEPSADVDNAIRSLRGAGVATRFLVETAGTAAALPLSGFEKVETVASRDGWDVSAPETPFHAMVKKAPRILRELNRNQNDSWLIWLQSRGVPPVFAAPREFVELYLDWEDDAESDGDALAAGKSARKKSARESDRQWRQAVREFDALFSAAPGIGGESLPGDDASRSQRTLLGRLYAAYVSLLDAALGELLDALEPVWDDDLLLIVTSVRGDGVGAGRPRPHPYPLLAEDIIQAPLLIRPPGFSLGNRQRRLVQTVDLAPTLCEWFAVPHTPSAWDGRSLLPIIRGEEREVRPHAIVRDGNRAAGVRTQDYYFVQTAESVGEAGRAGLFVKPDDAWEIHDVSQESPEQAESLAQILADSANCEPRNRRETRV